MPAPHDFPNTHDDLEPDIDPLDEAVGPSWDRDRQLLIYWFPDMQKAIFHGNIPDPRWELRRPDGSTIGRFKTYDRLLLARQDSRRIQVQEP